MHIAPQFLVEALAVIVVAMRDVYHYQPCRQKLSCAKSEFRHRKFRSYIERCWNIVLDENRPETLKRLRFYYFACKMGHVTARAPWNEFEKSLNNSQLRSIVLASYKFWSQGQKRNLAAEELIARLFATDPPLTIPAAEYVLAPLCADAKYKIATKLYAELQRVCRAELGDQYRHHQPALILQFSPELPSRIYRLFSGAV